MSTSRRAGSVNSRASSTVTPGISPTVRKAAPRTVEHLAVHLRRGTRGSGGRSTKAAEPSARASGVPPVAVRVRPSGSAGSLEMKLMTSIRKPSTPRSSHQRIIAYTACLTSRVLPVQVGLPDGEQVQVVLAGRLVEGPGGAGEERPPVRRLGARRARPRSRRAAAATSTSPASGRRPTDRDATNHGCADEVWLTTRSSTSLMPRSCSAAISASRSASEPNSGSTSCVVADVVPVVLLRRGVDRREPDDVDAERRRGGRGARGRRARSPTPSPSPSAKLRG